MQASEKVGNTKIREQHKEERHDATYVVNRHKTLVADNCPLLQPREMQQQCIYEHGDQRPGLLRVPAPIPAP